MKRWRKYVVCLTCICCLGLLTGCGNDTVTESEQMTEKKDESDNVNHVTEPGTDTGQFNEEEQTNALTGDRADQLNGDVTDGSNAAENIGDAGADIVDGVGDAGKDVIDGVENAADSLTGNTDDQAENRAE